MFIEPFSVKTSQSNLIDELDLVAMSFLPHFSPFLRLSLTLLILFVDLWHQLLSRC